MSTALLRAASALGNALVRVVANQRRLDNRSWSVGFTVQTDSPFFEVVATTDRTLFAEDARARRTPKNFFASRSLRLTPSAGVETTYFVPPAVIRELASAAVAEGAIYFTAIGYDDESGANPHVAMTSEELAHNPPSIEVSPDFSTQSLARAVGLSFDGRRNDANGAHSAATAASGAKDGPAAPRASWKWEATGTMQIPTAQSLADAAVTPFSVDADGWDRDDDNDVRAGAHGLARDDDDDDRDARDSRDARDDYDDGFGTEASWLDNPSNAREQEAPPELVDSEAYGAADPYGSAAYSSEAYGDEADVAAPPPASPPAPSALPPPERQVAIFEEVARTLDGRLLYASARAAGAEGAAFGAGDFTQRSGQLGRVLAAMRERDPAQFDAIVGSASAELLRVVTDADEARRMSKVAGAALTDPVWLERFEKLGAWRPFVSVQNQSISELLLKPMWPVVDGLGLTSERALAAALVLSIALGTDAAASWICARVSAVQTKAQLQQALAALGDVDARSFQKRAGLDETGELDCATQAALTRSLRGLAAKSPLPVLQPVQMLEALVRQAAGEPFGKKIASVVSERSALAS